MLPPVFEIYVVWHPGDDAKGAVAAQQLVEHFRDGVLRADRWRGRGLRALGRLA
jgi:hypothetical protein